MDKAHSMAESRAETNLEASTSPSCWRVSEDIAALSRRLDALERFCGVELGEDGLQARILTIMTEALCKGGSMEQTRDCSGLRAKAAVDQLQERYSMEMEKLHHSMADMQRSIQDLEDAALITQKVGDPMVRSWKEATHQDLEEHLAHALAGVRDEAITLLTQLRTEIIDRVTVLESQADASRSPESVPFPPSPQALSSKPALSERLSAAGWLEPTGLKVSSAPWSSGSLQESTEELRKCLKDLNE